MVKGVVFDLDGTLYLGDKAVYGAVETVNALIEQGYQVFYLTNNSGKTRWQIVQKLNKMGFGVSADSTYCGSYAISTYLACNKITPIYVIGTDNLKNELISYDIGVEDSTDVSAVVVGIDLSFSYEKITMALEAISNGAKLIVANTDSNYPVGNNRKLPGCGAMVAAIVASTGHVPDFHVGKPNVYMLDLICKEHRLSSADICVVGDSIESDIAMAIKFGCQSILFDSEGVFLEFIGKRAEKLHEIISLINN